MAVSLVGGAALGAVFGELLKAVEVVTLRAVDFKPVLERLSSTLTRIRPKIEEINDLNRDLGISEAQAETLSKCLREGPSVVEKCEKVKWWNCLKKAKYTKKLMNLESMLKQYLDIDMPLDLTIDNKRILKRMTTNGGFGNGNELVGLCGAPQVPDFVVGFDEPLQELKNRIMKGEKQVVVLSALGGCGKTTLAKMLCHDQQIKENFKDIFFVTFSKAPNLKVIIQKLFQHKGVSVPEFQTDEDAINQLEYMLKKIGLHPINQLDHKRSHPILLVLDDVWSGSESLVEKFKFQIPEYKILVTSRSVFPRFSTYELKLLKDEDAMVLFRYCAFPQNEISNIPDDLVNKIIRGCRKVPLALEVVGKSLCGNPKAIWEDTLKQWSEGQSVFYNNNSMNELFFCLQTSLDALDDMDHIKECFLDLAAFPEDQRIPVTALVDMWVELYGLDEDGGNSIVNLYKLSNRNLIKLVLTRKDTSEITGYYDEYFVTQHDLLRDLAIHQSGPNPIIKKGNRLIIDIRCDVLPSWWTEQMQHPIGAHLVSISTDEMFKSNWYNIQLPMVEVLVLNIQSSDYTLPQFMEEINRLKVLIITNYGFCSAEIRNFPVLGHLSSLKRIRLEHVSISSIEPFLQLKNLQKISLVMCEIDKAFRTYTAQVPDMLPNLTEIAIDYCHDLVEFSVWLCNISCLQKLSITNCNELIALPEEFGKLENLEVLRLHACPKLKQLPESIGSLRKLGFLELSVCISISKLPDKMGELCGLRKLHMRGCYGLSELPSSVQDLKQLKNLICDEETAYLWDRYKDQLKSLEVQVIKEEVNLDWLHADIFS